jgi:hypothetical protein
MPPFEGFFCFDQLNDRKRLRACPAPDQCLCLGPSKFGHHSANRNGGPEAAVPGEYCAPRCYIGPISLAVTFWASNAVSTSCEE